MTHGVAPAKAAPTTKRQMASQTPCDAGTSSARLAVAPTRSQAVPATAHGTTAASGTALASAQVKAAAPNATARIAPTSTTSDSKATILSIQSKLPKLRPSWPWTANEE